MQRLIAYLLLLVSFSGPLSMRAADADSDDPLPPHWNVLSLRPGALEAAAKIKGHFTFTRHTSMPWVDSNLTLNDLIEKATLIVVGTVGSHRSFTFDDGRLIATEYNITVSQNLKGDAISSVKVGAPGGKVVFPDGTWAQMRSPSWQYMLTGTNFLFFLRANKQGEIGFDADRPQSEYNIVGWTEGAIQLNWDQSIIAPLSSRDGYPHLLTAEVANLSPSALIQKVVSNLGSKN